MLEVTARDGRSRLVAWKPEGGQAALTPHLAWPENSLATPPAWCKVAIGAAVPGKISLGPEGTWFHPKPASPGTIGVPAVAPAPTTRPQVILGDELAILHDAGAWATRPKAMVEALSTARREAASRILWAPALGLPQDYAMWAYLGVDLFDASPLLLAAVRGQALTTDGSMTAAEAARMAGEATPFTTKQLIAHNLEAARRELALVQVHIEKGTLRELVERRVHAAATTVETLRLFDREFAYLEAWAPRARATPLRCMTAESLGMPEVEAFRRRLRERYLPPPAEVLVLLPCSARKPYKLSRSHRHYLRVLEGSGIRASLHEVMVTSPLGIVPRDLEEIYPAAHYDIPVTGHWTRDELAVVREQVSALLAKGRYRHVVAHLPKDTLAGLADLVPEARHTVQVHPTSSEDLARLAQALGELKPLVEGRVADRRLTDLTALATYQFGPEVAADLAAGAHAQGRAPYVKVVGPEGQRAMTNPERGQLSLTPHGASALMRHGCYRVHLKPFDLKRTSSLFAIGVAAADPEIRPGDEVALVGAEGELAGCGTAQMSTEEMTSSRRGVAVTIRHLAGRPIEVTP
ncbi:MAG: DUF5591 domain-containing protein [Thermoplasmatota archaeon]